MTIMITITIILLITCLAAKEIREALDIIADILKIRYYLKHKTCKMVIFPK